MSLLLIVGFVVLYFIGVAVGSYIKGRYFPDNYYVWDIVALWPIAMVLALPAAVIGTVIMFVLKFNVYIEKIGYKRRELRKTQERNRRRAAETINNLELFDDASV